MAETALQTIYRQEFIAGFEQRQSLLRDSVTTEANVDGNQAVFLVADSGSATAVTRGANGLIPARADNLSQLTAVMQEWHDLVRKTRFNIALAQGDQRAIMQQTTMAVINRKVDSDIIAQLQTASNQISATAAPMTVGMVAHAIAALGNNGVPFDGNVWGLISSGALAYLMQTTEFSSADYVQRKPFDNGAQWNDQPGFYQWYNTKWVVHPNVPGVGTSSEELFVYHKSAVGHAIDMEGFNTAVGYDEEQDYSYCRASTFMGSKMLQQSGVIEILHNAAAFATV